MRCCILIIVICLASIIGAACAEEGASGHYLPGSLASAIDMTPSDEAVVVRLALNNYEGELGGTIVPVAGLMTTDINIDTKELALDLIWNQGGEPAEGWLYAASITIPHISVKISASIVDDRFSSRQVSRESAKESGVGDLILRPLMLSHAIDRNWWGDFRFAIYAPTGSYEVGRLANTGKNYWTFSPAAALINIDPAIGREFSVFGGVDFNTKNSDTHYKTGIQAHVESTFVQNVIFFGGFTGIGVSGYWYKQLTGDQGEGAVLGGFKSQAVGAGPIMSYRAKWVNTEIIAELKWLHEFETKRRYEGDTLSFKISAKY